MTRWDIETSWGREQRKTTGGTGPCRGGHSVVTLSPEKPQRCDLRRKAVLRE
ncbi:predicted protein [Streptomyces viridosporus ATCC 14672]|uniref:Predicted protein n=1 Tax=Streptomyces viridosporus (strain ATCC 14672 / DSM 40746 / JCM 4963 / KCTC 9882 / NRRL B-12104 / FH 1290) TaxID=566461 RepID=D6A6E5_STRV1|nr:predicted protein [Streptomyces viridosporus ATCC 14672]